MTDTVFKFVSQRPPQLIEDQDFELGYARPTGLDADSQSEFLALEGQELYEYAKSFLHSDDYTSGESNLVAAVKQALDSEGVLGELIEQALETSVDDFLASEDAHAYQERLWLSYYAQVAAPDIRPEDRASIAAALWAFHVLRLVAGEVDEERIRSGATLSDIRIAAPKGLISIAQPDPVDISQGVTDLQERLNELGERTRDVVAISSELMRDPLTAPLDEPKVVRQEIQGKKSGVPRWLGALLGANTDARSGSEQVDVERLTPWPWTEPGRDLLSDKALQLLNNRNDLQGLSAPEIVDRLDDEIRTEVEALLAETTPEEHALIASSDAYMYIAATKPVHLMRSHVELANYFPTPRDRGIRPLGIGDLMLVEQELLRYTAGEVAHIENVMATEERHRRHHRVRETEEIFITETERLEESEKDLQTTERFELHNEAERTIESEMSAEAGVEVSGSYGFVTVTAHGEFALSQSRSESERNSSDFAREVTERSLSRIVERAREERTRRTLERFEETNKHGFDNTAQGATHIRGVYRWVDKYYKARLINYGRRLMMEFVVPEPASFFLHVESGQSTEVPFSRPSRPMIGGRALAPGDLTSANVDNYVRDYHVANVDPYPAPTRRVGASFTQAPGAGQTKNVHFASDSDEFVVPAGYKADGGYSWSSFFSGYDSRYWSLKVGGRSADSMSLSGLEGSIPVAANGWGSSFSFQMTFSASVTPETRRSWQLDTYDKIMTAYQQLEARYQEALAAAEIAAGVAIEGRNPDINRQVEKDELQRAALDMLTNHFQETIIGSDVRYYETFDATHDGGPFGYPIIDPEEAMVEGKIIQFFEQAFEWHNMTYIFYPYFWGRKRDWDETFDKLDHPDPAFASFLRAGSARIVVPAHPAYTEAVLFYLETSAIWNGGTPPTIDDPLYVSIVDELRARSDEQDDPPQCADGVSYPCVVDEWEVKLPTSLVWLQDDGELPDHSENNDGQ